MTTMKDQEDEIIVIDESDSWSRASHNEGDGRDSASTSSSNSFQPAQPRHQSLTKSSINSLEESDGEENDNGASIICCSNGCDGGDTDNSSSSSSGIPSPWRKPVRPPSVVHAKVPNAERDKEIILFRISKSNDSHDGDSGESNAGSDSSTSALDTPDRPKPIKRRCIKKKDDEVSKGANERKNNDSKSKTTKSKKKATSKKSKDAATKNLETHSAELAQQTKKGRPKKRFWGNKRRYYSKTSDKENNDNSVSTSVEPSRAFSKPRNSSSHFHCYLLRSLDPDFPLKSYIGFTTDPRRRLRQHNGILKNGGARRTKRSGRPWTFVCVIHGFQDKITALQFEWAWQNVDRAKAFREAVGCDKLAKKMKRRLGAKARLDELRILLNDCVPFSLYSLTVYFPEEEYHDLFCKVLEKGKNIEESECDDNSSPDSRLCQMNFKVCSLEDMPFAKESAAQKEKNSRKGQHKITEYIGSDEGSGEEKEERKGEEEDFNEMDDSNAIAGSGKDFHINNDSSMHFHTADHSSIDLCSTESGREKSVSSRSEQVMASSLESSSKQMPPDSGKDEDIEDILDFKSLSIDVSFGSRNGTRNGTRTAKKPAIFDDTSISSMASSCDSFEKGSTFEKGDSLSDQNGISLEATKKCSTTALGTSKYEVLDLCDSP